MKETLDENTMKNVKELYNQYKEYRESSADLTRHNKEMKNGFMDKYFDLNDENTKVDAEGKKKIKKEINKYFRTIEEVGSGSDPIDTRDIRKEHLGLEENVYKELMEIFGMIQDNVLTKEKIADDLGKLYIKMGLALEIASEVAKDVLDLWYKEEIGKFPITVAVVDCYKRIATELNKEE